MDNAYPTSKHLTYRADIDGLRAIAVFSVVFFHAFPELLSGGFIGVDVFFVISGFLISTLLFQSLENNAFSIINFYQKRIKRLFPALVIVLIFCLALGWFALFPFEYKQLGKHIAGGAGFISNFILWFDTGYFDSSADTKPLLHLWSLGIEEQFYLVWPVLIWSAWKKKFNLLTVIILIIFISFCLNLVGMHSHAIATFYSPHTRFWELLSGSLLAWMIVYEPNSYAYLTKIKFKNRLGNQQAKIKNLLSFTGLSFLLISMSCLTKDFAFPGAWALLPVFGALLLIGGGKETWINRCLLSHPIMVWFGLISYPIYLWHWPLLSFARIMEDGTPNQYIRLGTVGISILFAWFTYRLIEQPIRKGSGSFERTKISCLLVFMLVVACCGIYIKKNNGLEFRFNKLHSPQLDLIANPYPPVENEFACGDTIPLLKKYHFDGLCSTSKKREPDIMFLGDSHTLQFKSAVWSHFVSHSLLMVVEVSCLPFSGDHFFKGDCKKKQDAVISYLQSNKSIKQVYLSGYWAYLMAGGFAPGNRENWRQAKPLSAQEIESFIKNGRNLLSKILETNKEVIFMKDIPDLNFNINFCFEERPLKLPFGHKTKKDCSMLYAKYKKRMAAYDQVIDKLLEGFTQIKIYNPRPIFCNKERCKARDQSLPYYYNGDHLNHYGANIVLKDMLKNTALNA